MPWFTTSKFPSMGFQIRILAPRALHFSRMKVFWEYGWNYACGTFPDQLLPQFHHGSLLRREIPSMTKVDNTFTEKHLRFTIPTWDSIVMVFMFVKLFFSRDKPVAVSGIAKHVQQSLRPLSYWALAWLFSPDIKTHIYVKVLEISITNSTGSWFGEVSGDILKLCWEALISYRRTKARSFQLHTGQIICCCIYMDFEDKLPEGDGSLYLLPIQERIY